MKKQKMPRDASQLARRVIEMATGEPTLPPTKKAKRTAPAKERSAKKRSK